jgi:hypothetical protein
VDTGTYASDAELFEFTAVKGEGVMEKLSKAKDDFAVPRLGLE